MANPREMSCLSSPIQKRRFYLELTLDAKDQRPVSLRTLPV